MVVIPKKASDGVEVPYLVWGPIPNFQATGYKIYWSLNTEGGPPGTFGLLATVSANTYEYAHEGLAANDNWKAYYKVKAYNSSTESGFTNTAEIGVSGFYKDNSNNTVDNYDFNLQTNYPNPFNPTTIIKYQLPEDAHVKLIIYDVLCREVTTLVNEVKKVGSYEVEFNATRLTSGVYFYQISAGKFVSAKKMLLVR